MRPLLQEPLSEQKAKRALLTAALVCAAAFACFLIAVFTLNGLLVTSVAASAFIAFAFPHADSARPRCLLGGYVCAAAAGLLGSTLRGAAIWGNLSPYAPILVGCALAVFAAAFLMVLMDFEHPPAAALAVSVTIDAHPLRLGLVALCCAAALCLLRFALSRRAARRQAKDGRKR